MMNILNERSISVLHGIWNQNQLHKHLEEKIYKCVISSLYNIIRLFFTPNQDNHFTRRFIYVLSQVFCDQEMCMFIFSIEILREEQLNRLYYMMNLVVVKEEDHTGHNSCMMYNNKRIISNRLSESHLENVSYTNHAWWFYSFALIISFWLFVLYDKIILNLKTILKRNHIHFSHQIFYLLAIRWMYVVLYILLGVVIIIHQNQKSRISIYRLKTFSLSHTTGIILQYSRHLERRNEIHIWFNWPYS